MHAPRTHRAHLHALPGALNLARARARAYAPTCLCACACADMNNASAEIAGADAYADTMRFFTVGQETKCGDPKKGLVDCSQPFAELSTPVKPSGPGGPCAKGTSCRELWAKASSAALGNTVRARARVCAFQFSHRG